MDQLSGERSVIRQLASLRSNLIELIVVAVLLSFGVDLAGHSVGALLAGKELLGIGIGIIVSSLALSYFFFKVLSQRPEVFLVKGFLHVVEKEDSVEIRPAHRYELSERTSEYLHAAFVENPALLRAWLSNPLRFSIDRGGSDAALDAKALLNQVVEYFYLDRLSKHLSGYFQEQGIAEEECQKFTRRDIPDVLLENRFLEIFSKPMEERVHFSGNEMKGFITGPSPARVVSATGRDGVLFDLFELILPKGSNVSRSTEGFLRIETAIFTMEFRPGIEGFNTVTPLDFEKLYMDDANWRFESPTLVRSQICVTVKRRALLLRVGWDYYRWLDSFISEYYENAQAARFFEAIGWETAVTTSQIMAVNQRIYEAPVRSEERTSKQDDRGKE
jgi:hypothetical protein